MWLIDTYSSDSDVLIVLDLYLVPPERRGRLRVPVSVSHVAIGESSKELAKPNLWMLAILAQSSNIYFS